MAQMARPRPLTVTAPHAPGVIQRHPVLMYFAAVFALSWGGVLLVVGGRSGFPATPEESQRLLPLALMIMLVGPCVAGLLMTGLVDGRAGFRELLARLRTWRVDLRWYAVALLMAPLVVMVLLLALSLISSWFLPVIFTTEDKTALLLGGLAAGLAAGVFEEVGWTGFAIPRLRRRYGVLAVGVIVGLVWAAWHVLVYAWGSGDASGAFSMALFLPELVFFFGVLTVYRVLMGWVYDHTGSLLVAMLMHAGLAGSVPMVLTPVATGVPRVAYYLILTAVLWAVVAVVTMATRRQRAHPTFQAREAPPALSPVGAKEA